MIGAVIYYGKNTLVAELPMGTMDLQIPCTVNLQKAHTVHLGFTPIPSLRRFAPGRGRRRECRPPGSGGGPGRSGPGSG